MRRSRYQKAYDILRRETATRSIHELEAAKKASTAVRSFVDPGRRSDREMTRRKFLNSIEVWDALLQSYAADR